MPETIFIVDDDEYALRTYQRVLRREPYVCRYFSSPDEALDAAERIEPAVVVSDQQMPQMLGTEFLAKIKEILPIASRIIITGVADIDTAILSINKGHVYRFIKKPWEDSWLRMEIRRALEYYNTNLRLQLLSELNMDEQTIHRERLQGVLEMAGAVCHEFAQPLQAIAGYCSMLMPEEGQEQTEDFQYLYCIQQEVEKLGDLLFKVMSIGDYKTRIYMGVHKIIDIDAASTQPPPSELFRHLNKKLADGEQTVSYEKGGEDD